MIKQIWIPLPLEYYPEKYEILHYGYIEYSTYANSTDIIIAGGQVKYFFILIIVKSSSSNDN